MMIGYLLLLYFSTTLANPQVKLGNTLVNGAIGSSDTEFFGNLSFAEPPVNELRFLPPVPVTTLSGNTFDATNFGAGCPQAPSTLSGATLSEDCLKLNVIRPARTTSNSKLPVMVWIYGGDFRVGDASTYNGTQLVAHSIARGTPIIYVNFNYRLGSLGFPTGYEAESKGALNLGLRDQIAALSWVQSNIEQFGGDKMKVTLFGESAGAIAIADLFLNSHLEDFVRAAIFESGTMGSNRLLTPAEGQPLWDLFLSLIPQCANAPANASFECLRSVPVDNIVTAFNTAVDGAVIGWTPVIDGPNGFIPDLPSKLVAEGKFSHIPFISGTNLDEGTLFVDSSVNDTVALEHYIASQLPGISDPSELNVVVQRMMQLYPNISALGSPFGTGSETFGLSTTWKRAAAISCDVNFAALRRGWIQAASAYGVTTYGYLFNDPQTGSGYLGISHGSEVPYVYGYPVFGDTLGSTFPPSPGYSTLSPLIMDYWISFAASLNPNDGRGSQRAFWESYTLSRQVLVQLHGDNVTLIPDNFRTEQILFINSNAPAFGH